MKLIGMGAAMALAMSASLAAQQAPAHGDHDDKKVTLTGCVVKGNGGYMLTNTSAAGMHASHGAHTTAASPEIAGRTFYYLDDDDDLEKHAGKRVEVEGELEGDVEKGTISVERENGMIELEFKVDGDKKVTVKVPELPAAVGTSGAVTDREQDHHFLVKKLEVEKVKVLADSCQ